MAPGNELCRELSLNCVRFQVSMVSGTGLLRGSATQWNWGRFFNIIRVPHSAHLLAGFVDLQRAEPRLNRNVKNKIMIRSEERNNIVLKQQLVCRQTHGTYR